MAKKILAVVLAVMMAVSAMAVSVFADYEINLHRTVEDSSKHAVTVTFDLPVYGLYGYLNAGDYAELTLPDYWGDGVNGVKVSWSIIVDGVEWALETRDNAGTKKGDTFVNYVYLGYVTHPFDKATKSITVPQNTAYTAGAQSWRLQAKFEDLYGKDAQNRVNMDLFKTVANGGTYGDGATAMKAQWYREGDQLVPQSVSYAATWNPTRNDDSTKITATYDFVTNEWNATSHKTDSYVPLTWDHNLYARAAIMGAESAELVVELNKPIIGRATYTLYANGGYDSNSGNFTSNDLWWTHNATRVFVDLVSVDSAVDEDTSVIRFKVPVDVLWEGNYGTFNRQFVIFEEITLYNDTLMNGSYMTVDVDANRGGVDGGSYGLLSWDPAWGRTRVPLKYAGKEVNYARTGKAGEGVVIGYQRYVAPPAADIASGVATVESNGNYWGAQTDLYGGDLADVQTAYQNLKADDVITFTSTDGKNFGIQVGGDFANYSSSNGVLRMTGAEFTKDQADGTVDYAILRTGETGPVTVNIEVRSASQYDAAGNLIGVPTTADDPNAVLVACNANDEGAIAVYSGNNDGANVMANRIYLRTLTADDNTDTVPETPTQGIGGEEDPDDGEGDNMNVADPEPEKNPHTGIALAVVPMLVAAAAAVVSKKH